MTDAIAGLGLKVDSGEVVKAASDLDRLVAAATKAEGAAKSLRDAWGSSTAKVSGNTAEIVAELRALNTAQKAQANTLAAIAKSYSANAGAVTALATATTRSAGSSKAKAKALDDEAKAAAAATRAIDGLADAHVRAQKQNSITSGFSFNSSLPQASGSGVGALASAGTGAASAALQGMASNGAAAASALQATAAASAAAGAAAGAAAPKFTGLGAAAAAGSKKAVISAGQTAQAFRTLPAQMTDIVTSLAGGQSPFLVLIQQGGQIKDSFGGIGPAIKAVASTITPFRLAVGGSALAVTALIAAIAAGRAESDNFAKSIALTGNAAGITEGQYNAMAEKISDATKTTIGGTRETLAALIETGRFTGATLEGAGTAVQGLSKLTGQATGDIIKAFTGAADGVAKYAQKTNLQYNFLTATQLDYIKTLEDQGNAQKALEVLFEALNKRISTASQNLGYLETVWNGVKMAASGAINEMLKIGRVKTDEETLIRLQDSLNAKREQNARLGIKEGRATQDLQAQVDAQQRLVTGKQEAAKQSAESARTEQAKTTFAELQDRYASKQAKREKEIADARAKGLAAKASEKQIAEVISEIEDRYKDKKAPKGRDTSRVDARAAILLEVEDYKSASRSMVDEITNRERILDARRSAGLLSESAYYQEKKQLLADQLQAQVEAIEKENALLGRQKLNTKDGLDRDREVLKNKGEIRKLQAGAATTLTTMDIQQQAAARAMEASVLSARQAAQDYFDTVNQGYASAYALLGKGDIERTLQEGIQQIYEKYQGQRRDLENQRAQAELQAGGKLTEEARKQYDARLLIINEFQEKAVASYTNSYGRMQTAQQNWEFGATRALANVADQSKNVAGDTERAFTNAFSGATDALVEFTAGGKLSVKSLVDSIIRDLARMAIKQNITSPLASGLSSIIGRFFSPYSGSSNNPSASNYENQMDRGFTRSAKGNVFASPDLSTYSNTIVTKPTMFAKGGNLMGEAGPEAIMPLRRGSDGRLGVAGAGGGGDVIVHNYAGAEIESRQEENGSGGFDTVVLVRQIEGMIGENIRGGRGAAHSAIRDRFGLKPSSR